LRVATPLLLAAVFLTGVAHVAILPPFEGMDEVAHWSSIQQIADEGHIPVYGTDRISADTDRYPGPRPSISGQPFRDWFDRSAGPVDTGPTQFAPGSRLNWEAQHPPLYYLLLAPLYRLVAGLSWPAHLLVLRLASWMIAFAGFAWGAIRTQSALGARGYTDCRLLLPALWPFLFPQFFPEMGRLTNDTLCLLLLAGVWATILAAQAHGLTRTRAATLGGLLAAGLLTKAFFLPVCLGVAILLRPRQRQSILPPALMLGIAAAIGGPWYLTKWLETGSIIGADDFIAIEHAGGLMQGLATHFSLSQYILGMTRIVGSFA
jgi:hypothetical protein